MKGPNTSPLTLTHNRAAKLLIIDDEPSVLSVLNTLLCRAHDCKTAPSAVEAIEYLKEETYDLFCRTL
jgi:DNA-binding NtrC family response regulator